MAFFEHLFIGTYFRSLFVSTVPFKTTNVCLKRLCEMCMEVLKDVL